MQLPPVQLPSGYAAYQGSGSGGSGRSIIAGDQNITHSTVVHNQDQTKQVRQCAVSGRQAEVTRGHVCPSCGLWVHVDYYDRALMRCDHCRTAQAKRATEQFRAKVQQFLSDGVMTKEELIELRSLGGNLSLSLPEQDTIIAQFKQEMLRSTSAQRPMSLIDQSRWKAVLRAVENKVFSTDPVAGRVHLDSLRALHKSYPEDELIASLLVSILSEEMINDPALFLPEVERVLNASCFAHDTPRKYLTRAVFYRGGTLLGQARVPHSDGEGNWADMLERFDEAVREAAAALENMFPNSEECHALQIAMMIDSYLLSGDESIREEVNLLLEGAACAAGESDVGLALKAAHANATEGQGWGNEREMAIGQGLARAYFADLFSLNRLNLLKMIDEADESQVGKESTIIEDTRRLATKGDPEAQFKLGLMYQDAEGEEKNDAEAARWFRKAAEQGHAAAQNKMGNLYATGSGVTQNFEKAMAWYQLAADQGYPGALYNLGRHHLLGLGTATNHTEAVKRFRKAADQGHAGGQFSLGLAYAEGRGVEQDDSEAVKWFRLAAEQGDADAQIQIGHMYANGRGVEEDDAEAVKWFHLSAEQGDAVAQYNLGDFYANGYGVEQDDAEAVKWYRLAAEQGDADAQYFLGDFYAEGRGVEQDDSEAVKWFLLAAEQGNADAQHYLGGFFAQGRGVAQDYAEAMKWFCLAAEQGDAHAQCNLGLMYSKGRGVVQDDAEAMKWYRLAAEQGNEDAQRALARLDPQDLGMAMNHTKDAHSAVDGVSAAKIGFVISNAATPPPLPTSSRGSEIGMIDVASIVDSDAENLRDEHIFIHPSIPDSKLANARRKMKCPENHVIMLIDNTIFGSAKDGAIVTPNGLYVHNMGETARFLEWKQIHTVQGRDFLGGVTLLINGLDFLTMNLPSACAAHAFANLVRRISESHHQLK
jgi:TPR repeat protein